MQIAVKAKNRKLSPAEEELIRKKVGRLPRYLDLLSDAEIIVGEEHPRRGLDQEVVQLTVRANGTLLRAEERADEMQAALDQALAKIERRIERYKGRRMHTKKGRTHLGTALGPPATDEVGDEEAEEEAARPIVRTKRFKVQPMERADAIEQMELLGHNFFIFWDAESKHIAVLYRREGGDYGVLEPDLA